MRSQEEWKIGRQFPFLKKFSFFICLLREFSHHHMLKASCELYRVACVLFTEHFVVYVMLFQIL